MSLADAFDQWLESHGMYRTAPRRAIATLIEERGPITRTEIRRGVEELIGPPGAKNTSLRTIRLLEAAGLVVRVRSTGPWSPWLYKPANVTN